MARGIRAVADTRRAPALAFSLFMALKARNGSPAGCPTSSWQVLEKQLQIGELARSVDLGVRGKDLLDQGRTRTRQPDDEGWPSIRIAPASGLCQKPRVERVDGLVNEGRILAGVIDTSPSGTRRGLKGIGRRKKLRGLSVMPLGVMNCAQTEMDQPAGVIRDVLLVP